MYFRCCYCKRDDIVLYGGVCGFCKENKMDKLNYKEAIKEIDNMKSIGDDGKKEVKRVISALCGEEIEKEYYTSGHALYLPDGYGVCSIKDGYLYLYCDVGSDLVRKDHSGRILVKQGDKILNGDE